MAPRRFEIVEASKATFWTIEVTESSHVERSGAVDTPGFPRTRSFPSPAAAVADAEKLIAEKLRKGWIEIRSALRPRPATTAEAPEVGLTYDAESEWLHATFSGQTSFGPLVTVMLELLGRESPRALRVRCDGDAPGDGFAAVFYGRKGSSLRALVLDTEFRTQAEQRAHRFGDLRLLLRAMPNLQSLFANGEVDLTPASHYKLRELHLLGDPLPGWTIASLARSAFPALQILAISISSGTRSATTADELADALLHLDAPQLSMVTLAGVGDVADTLDALTRAPLPGSWTRLAILGPVGDEGALVARIRERAGALGGVTLTVPLSGEALRDLPVKFDPDVASPCEAFGPKAYEEW